MLTLRCAVLSLGLLSLTSGCKLSSGNTKAKDAQGTDDDTPPSFACGKPLVDAIASHVQGLAGLDQKSESDALAAMSQANMNDLRAAVGNMSDDEKKLYEASKQNPYGNTHRGSFRSLHKILTSGGVIAPNASGNKIAVKVTPPPEDELYGAFSCVFTAVGPEDGRPRYGDTILHFKDHASTPSWGTYSSAYTFMKGQRTQACDVQCECKKGQNGHVPAGASCNLSADAEIFTFNDLGDDSCEDFCEDTASHTMTSFTPTDDLRVAYGKTVIAPQDWKEWFAYTLVQLMRTKDDKADQTAKLLDIASKPDTADRHTAFWAYVDTKWLGYIEAKYEGKTNLADIESIEVPADKYAETQTWNDVPDDIIHTKITKVKTP